jgi:hypothetical protein
VKASHRASWAAATVLALAAAAASSVFAQAAEGGRGQGMAAELQKRFTAADTNHDGRLTKEEAKAGMPFVYKNFDEIDSAKTGSLSMHDIAGFVRAKAAARKASG